MSERPCLQISQVTLWLENSSSASSSSFFWVFAFLQVWITMPGWCRVLSKSDDKEVAYGCISEDVSMYPFRHPGGDGSEAWVEGQERVKLESLRRQWLKPSERYSLGRHTDVQNIDFRTLRYFIFVLFHRIGTDVWKSILRLTIISPFLRRCSLYLFLLR